MKLTKNFTLEELVKSTTAKRLGIDNTPNEDQLFYLKKLAEQLQIIRDEYGKPITVSSGLRVEKLNKAVGGAKNSDHKFGAAADFHSLSDTLEDNKELWNIIMKLYKDGQLACRQIIWEYGDQQKGPDWIHCSVNNEYNKFKNNEILHIV